MVKLAPVTITSGNGDISALQGGTGEKGLVFLHPGVADKRIWEPMVGELGNLGRVIAYDQRGYGATPAAKAPAGQVDLDDLKAVIDHLGLGRVWLIGNSMGGALAVDFAIRFPELIEGLFLIAPGFSGIPDEFPLDEDEMRIEEASITAEKNGDFDTSAEGILHIWLDGPRKPRGRVGGEARRLAKQMALGIIANPVAEGDAPDGPTGWPNLESLSIPTTLVLGEFDVAEVLAFCPVAAKKIPGCKLIKLQGRAHLPQLEDPAQIAALLEEATGSTRRT